MSVPERHPFKDAVGPITAGSRSGTGYLIAPGRAVTCHHVVAGADEIVIELGGRRYDATIEQSDEASDCALLALKTAAAGIEPMPLGGRCPISAPWTGYGYARAARGAGLTLQGIVRDAEATDDQGEPVLQLTSEEAAAGMAAPLHGLSGSPVVVDRVVVGHLKRIVPDPDDTYRPAFGQVYATPVAAVYRLLGQESPSASVPVPTAKIQSRRAQRVFSIWRGWRSAGGGGGDSALAAAQSLIAHGRIDQALEVLGFAPDGMRREQLRALALAKSDSLDHSIELLETLRKKGWLDPETAGLLAGRYKQKWQQSGEPRFLTAAYRTYVDCFEASNDPYTGINAAAMALQRGRRRDAAAFARRVLAGRLQHRRVEEMDQWDLATIAEAHLILKQLDDARIWYERAVTSDPMAIEHIAVMRRQVRRNLEALRIGDAGFDDILRVPRVAAFAGHMIDAPDRPAQRFPAAAARAIGEQIGRRLRALQIGYGFSSAARGGDLMFLRELLQRGGRAHVFLPFPADGFAATSVGQGWNDEYHAILADDRVDVTVLHGDVPPADEQPDAFSRCNAAISRNAVAFARRLDEEPVLLAVWSGQPGDGPGGPAEMVADWHAAGGQVEIIDPTAAL
jgi:tetratricopeptide (TPR) repeat protein